MSNVPVPELVQYGALGILIVSLLWLLRIVLVKMLDVIQKNTEVMAGATATMLQVVNALNDLRNNLTGVVKCPLVRE